MPWHRAAALVFALTLVLGGSFVDATSESPRNRPFKEGISVAASRLALEAGPDQASFNFARLRDLWVRVTVAGVTGARAPNQILLNLRLIDPQGTLVYEASVAYGTGRLPTVFPATALRDGFALDYALPVSSKGIERSLVEGTWRLVAEADGREFTTSFEVTTRY